MLEGHEGVSQAWPECELSQAHVAEVPLTTSQVPKTQSKPWQKTSSVTVVVVVDVVKEVVVTDALCTRTASGYRVS